MTAEIQNAESDPLSVYNVEDYRDADEVTGRWAAILDFEEMRGQVVKRDLGETLALLRTIDYVRNEMRDRLERLDGLEVSVREIVRDSVTPIRADSPTTVSTKPSIL